MKDLTEEERKELKEAKKQANRELHMKQQQEAQKLHRDWVNSLKYELELSGDRVEDVLLYIAKGVGTGRACKEVGISVSSVYKRRDEDEDYANRLVRAREEGNDFEFEQTIELAEEAPNKIYDAQGNEIFDRTHIQWKQQVIDVKKWRLAIKDPKKYSSSSRLQAELSGPNGGPIQNNISITQEEIRKMADEMRNNGEKPENSGAA